jgi:hypothetical protein
VPRTPAWLTLTLVLALPDLAQAQCAPNAAALGLSPLTAIRTYKGQPGGLYPGGANQPPAAHEAAALSAALSLTPVRGRVVLISIGMSNTTQEFSQFVALARGDARLHPALTIVDGAQGGQAADAWLDPRARTWDTVDARLRQAGVEPDQVRVAWVKQADRAPAQYGAFPAHADVLRQRLETIARNLVVRYPNLRLAFFSSRTHAFTQQMNALNPKPYAFESGFAVRGLIERQIAGDAGLNHDAQRGAVRAPLLLWGPYLWAEGTRADGFSWEAGDVVQDCTHPSMTGQRKVAQALLSFFSTNPAAAPWFLANPPAPDGGGTAPDSGPMPPGGEVPGGGMPSGGCQAGPGDPGAAALLVLLALLLALRTARVPAAKETTR